MKALSYVVIVLTLTMFAMPALASAPLHVYLQTAANISVSCQQETNSACLKLACHFGHCDLQSETEQVAIACRGLSSGECVRTLCHRSDDCDLLSRFKEYAGLCAGR